MRNEKPGGQGDRAGAVGLLDAAVWDLLAKLQDKPLWYVLAARFGNRSVGPISIYASGGHYRDSDDLTALRNELRSYLDLGYTLMKIKVGALPLSADLHRIEAALQVLGSGGRLAIDCNASMSRERAFELLKAVEPFQLAWVEEPVDPLDFALHGELASTTPLPLGTGENLFSAADTLNLLRHAGLRPHRDLLQMDISLSYGIVEYLQILALLETHGWPRAQCYPHAGHWFSLNVVAGLGLGMHESAPRPGHWLGGLPAGASLRNGKIALPDAPGVGLESDPHFQAVFADLITP
jgi:L-alanine-DL-glutamate epimerase-like enolase superfamily enzyme